VRQYRPRSIVSLILVGFAVVLTPFIAAVVTAVIQVDRLAQGNRSAVLATGQATEESRALVEQITDMRRALGQFAVRGDRDFFTIYLDARTGFRTALGNLLAIDIDGIDVERLQSLDVDESALFDSFGVVDRMPTATLDWAAAAQALEPISRLARAAAANIEGLTANQANEAVDRAEAVQRMLLVLTAAAVPVTIILIAGFTVLITRPMQALARSIRSLGGKSLTAPIEITGPQDIETLGTELDALRRRINSLENQKTTFLRQISHELKTPLTTLREGSELLAESLDEESPEDAEIARLMQENGRRLQSLIEDLLSFAKTQELISELELQSDVDMQTLLDETIDAQLVVAEAKDIAVQVDAERAYLRCDPKKVRSVIDNLLSNAIKYTPESGTVSVRVRKRQGQITLDVEDSGPGVHEADRSKIFEPFQQGRADYESSVKGTGLGLAIVKEYVDAHEGTVELRDSSVGAHFRVTLPECGPARDDD
jgi:two-component system sensor histidine kinase GlrK